MFTPDDIQKELSNGPVLIRDKHTKEVYRVNGIFMTPSIRPVNIATGTELNFAYGGQTWADFELLVAKDK
jgi:hypothetical protein